MTQTNLFDKDKVENKVKAFFSHYHSKHLDNGQILLMPGELPEGIMYINSGKIIQYDLNTKGEKIIINCFKPKAFFPMSWALNNTPNPYLYEASGAADIQIAPREDCIEFLQDNCDVVIELLSRVYFGTDGLLKSLSLMMGSTARNRLLNELVTYAKRFGEKNPDQSYNLRVTESELGSRTGLTRETVSRELHDLKKTDLILVSRGQILIRNLLAIEQMINS